MGSSDAVKSLCCFVVVGRIAGKTKVAMMDQREHAFVLNLQLCLKLQMRADEYGPEVLIMSRGFPSKYAFKSTTSRELHYLIWERNCGPVPVDMRVVHKDANSMDNRLCNLMLVSTEDAQPDPFQSPATDYGLESDDGEDADEDGPSLYWKMVLHFGEDLCRRNVPDALLPGLVESPMLPSDPTRASDDRLPQEPYFECHFLPCINMELEANTYNICGLCRSVRYCSKFCQLEDWKWHQSHCAHVLASNVLSLPDLVQSAATYTSPSPDGHQSGVCVPTAAVRVPILVRVPVLLTPMCTKDVNGSSTFPRHANLSTPLAVDIDSSASSGGLGSTGSSISYSPER